MKNVVVLGIRVDIRVDEKMNFSNESDKYLLVRNGYLQHLDR